MNEKMLKKAIKEKWFLHSSFMALIDWIILDGNLRMTGLVCGALADELGWV